MIKRSLFALSLFAACTASHAQYHENDLSMDFSAGVEKKICKGVNFSVEGNVRTQDYTRKIDRWDIGAALDFKLVKLTTFDLKGFVGWEYMWVNNLSEKNDKYEVTTYNDPVLGVYTQTDYEGYNLKHHYWRNRHRTSLGLEATYAPNKRWEFSLKETFQYSHYCKASTTMDKYRLDDDDELYLKESEFKDYAPKDRLVLRSKVTAKYDIKRCPLDPYVSVDYGCGINYSTGKWRYTAGTDIKLDKQNKFDVFYRYQKEDGDGDPTGHMIGLGYKYKF